MDNFMEELKEITGSVMHCNIAMCTNTFAHA